MVRKIKAQFAHAWVINIDTMTMIRFSPIDYNEVIDIPELGEKFNDAILCNYAKGLYNIEIGRAHV